MVDGRAIPAGRVEPLKPPATGITPWERGRMEATRTELPWAEPSRAEPTEGEEATERTLAIFRDFHYRIDEASGRIVVEVRDPVTGELIRQIPPEEMLRVLRSIHAFLGLRVDHRV